MRRDTVENIYASTSDRKKISKRNVTTQKANTAKSPDCKRSSALQNKVTSVATRKFAGSTKRDNTADKKQLKVSSANVARKPQKGKNFILENKLYVKKISSANKLQVDDSNPNNIPQNVCNNNMAQWNVEKFLM